MGKATKWLKGLLGMKKDKENVEINSNCGGDKREKKRWSFAKSGKDAGGYNQIPVDIPAADSAWLRSYIGGTQKEQNKHAIAVAAATAAAADAAVAAAQAAVAVVRLTSQGKGGVYTGGRERLAAVKIQTVFRGFLVCFYSFLFKCLLHFFGCSKRFSCSIHLFVNGLNCFSLTCSLLLCCPNLDFFFLSNLNVYETLFIYFCCFLEI